MDAQKKTIGGEDFMQKQAKQMIVAVILLIVFGAAYGGMHIYNQKQAEKIL